MSKGNSLLKSAPEKWVFSIVAAALLLVICGFVGTRVDGGPFFLSIAAVYIVLLCSLGEWLTQPRLRQRLLTTLLRGAGKGCVIGVCAWLAMMTVVAAMQDTGDKFVLYVVFFMPFALGVGALGGVLARWLGIRLRRIC